MLEKGDRGRSEKLDGWREFNYEYMLKGESFEDGSELV